MDKEKLEGLIPRDNAVDSEEVERFKKRVASVSSEGPGEPTKRESGEILCAPMGVHYIIKNGIEKFIETPCIEACKALWHLNIFTQESNANPESFIAWIALSNLDENNQQIFNSMMETDNHYTDECTYKEYNGIRTEYHKDNPDAVSEELLGLVEVFQMQDVQEGYMSEEEFLSTCCNYTMRVSTDGTMIRELVLEKTLEEYLIEKNMLHLYVPEEHRVYRDELYLNGHNKYLAYIKTKQQESNQKS